MDFELPKEAAEYMNDPSRDFFYDNPHRSGKVSIAGYVASEGIRVPDMIQDGKQLRAVVAANGEGIVRTDNTGDYAGYSGVMNSFWLNNLADRQALATLTSLEKDEVDKIYPSFVGPRSAEIRQGLIERDKFIFAAFHPRILDEDTGEQFPVRFIGEPERPFTDDAYFELADTAIQTDFYGNRFRSVLSDFGIEDPYQNGNSVSVWEFIPGVNMNVVFDDTVEGRLHVAGTDTDGVSATIMQDAGCNPVTNTIRSFNAELYDRLQLNLDKVREKAGVLRNLGLFSLDNSMSYELQLADTDDELYFLQAHMLRRNGVDYKEARDTMPDVDIEATFTRGSTPAGGRDIRLVVDWDHRLAPSHFDGTVTAYSEFGEYEEAIARGMQLMAPDVTSTSNPYDILPFIDTGAIYHRSRSAYYKPNVSMKLREEDLKPYTEQARAVAESGPGSVIAHATVYSDGRKGGINIGGLELVPAQRDSSK